MTVAETPVAVDVALRDGSTVRIRPVSEDDVQAANRGFGLVATAGTRSGSSATPRTCASRPIARRSPSRSTRTGAAWASARSCSPISRRPRSATASPPSRRPCTRPTTAWRRSSATPASRSTCTSGRGELHFELPASLDAEAVAALRGPRPDRGDRGRRARPAPGVGRRHRRLAPPGHRRRGAARQPARRRLPRCAARRASRRPRRSAACRPTGRSPTCPARSTSPSSPCRPPRCRTSRASAARPACARWSCSRPASPRSARDGARLQAELLEVCRASGMRLVGPELPRRAQHRARGRAQRDVRARDRRSRGRIAFASQSGAFGIAAIAEARTPRSRAVVVRLDRRQGRPLRQRLPALLGAGRRTPTWCCSTSSRSATRAGSAGSPARSRRRKPIVAVKSGRSAAGARAAASHTGALLAASDVTVDALFDHAGVIRTDTVGGAVRRRRAARRPAAPARRRGSRS